MTNMLIGLVLVLVAVVNFATIQNHAVSYMVIGGAVVNIISIMGRDL